MKRKKLSYLILFMACVFPAILLGCATQTQVVPDDWHAAGYQKVYFYYNGGLSSDFSYMEYFVKNSINGTQITYYGLPLPSSTSMGELRNPTKAGYRFYGWYQVRFDAFTKKEEYVWTRYVDKDGVLHEEKVINVKNEHAVQNVPYIKKIEISKEEYDSLPDNHKVEDGGKYYEAYNPERILTLNDISEDEKIENPDDRLFLGTWNFDFDRVTEDVCLVAIWEPIRYFVVVPPENKSDLFDEEGYEDLGRLKFGKIPATGALTRAIININLPAAKSGFQIEDLYYDRACKIRLFSTNTEYYPEAEFVDGEERFKVFPIYTKWIDAKFNKVYNATSINNMVYDQSYYVMNDLDFTGLKWTPPAVYKGEIRGNNYAWKNLSITINETEPKQNLNIYGGIFNVLDGAKIREITFENLNITFMRVNPSNSSTPKIWSNPVQFNIFAKSLAKDANSPVRSVVRDVVISEGSSYTIMNAVQFIDLMTVVYDENGFPYRICPVGNNVSLNVKASSWEWGKDSNGNDIKIPIYQEENTLYYGYNLRYDKNGLGEYNVRKIFARDPVDGKKLWGNQLISMPASAGPVIVMQDQQSNFGFDLPDNIYGCESYIVAKDAVLPWQIMYSFGDEIPPALNARDYTSNSNLQWAGWYEEIKSISGGVEGYRKFDFDAMTPSSEPVLLTAMWKEQ